MSEKEARAARLEVAAGWYAELQDEALAADVWERFLCWERDPENAAAFAQIETSLSLLDRTKFAIPPKPENRSRAKLWASAAGAAAVALAAAVIIVVLPPSPDVAPAAVQVESYTTSIGERRDIRLADGSALTLNTGSRLDVAFSPSERRVRLVQGQALFDVAPGASPFVVEAGGSLTTALGTEFDIHLRPEGAAITLLEGRVRVGQAGEARSDVLAPGQRLEFTRTGVMISQVDAGAAASWKSGMIRFRDVTLAEAVEEMNRYSETKVRLADPHLAEARLSGVFPAGDQDVFVESVSLFLDLEPQFTGEDILLQAAQ